MNHIYSHFYSEVNCKVVIALWRLRLLPCSTNCNVSQVIGPLLADVSYSDLVSAVTPADCTMTKDSTFVDG